MIEKVDKFPCGYTGKILSIDLTNKNIKTEPLDLRIARLFFGGRGIGIALLFKHFASLTRNGNYKNAFIEVDPLSENNVIILSTSPTTGTRMPTSGRIHMNFKSPLTGGYGSSNGGGKWAVEFKKNGFDAVVITGRSPKPVYILISPTEISIRDGSSLARLDATETINFLKENYGKRAQVLAIGKGGKNKVLFSSVMVDKGKALGRGGGGAVWGSKNLLAICAVSEPGTTIPVAHPESFDLKNKKSAMYHIKMKLDMGKFTRREENYGILSAMGSLGILGMVNNYKQLIHNNMKDTNHTPENINRISGEALRSHYKNAKSGEKRIRVKKSSCFNCPIACKRETTIIDEKGRIIDKGEGPEFESVTLLGANLSIYDLSLITQASYLANRYGLDTISLGGTIASFFELYTLVSKKEKLIDPEKLLLKETENFTAKYGKPGFGKPEILIPIIDLIGNCEDIGRYLAQGSYRFCSRYGHPELSMSVKKLELPAYDPRTSFSQALCYEMNNRGGCHLEGGYTAPHAYCAGYGEWPAHRIEGTALISKNATLKNTVMDIIGACTYGSFSLELDEYAALVNGVTGDNHDSGTLKEIARRTITLERTFNYLCGFTDRDDWLPDRFYNEQIDTNEGRLSCDRDGFHKMHIEYYRSMGWDDHGRPTQETLKELKLDKLIDGISLI